MYKKRENMELVLNSFGMALSKENNGFIISGPEGSYRVPVNGVKSIRIAQSAQITSDAIMLALDNEIELLFTDKGGYPKGRVWSPKYGSISTIRKGQIEFISSPFAVQLIKDIIVTKIKNQQALLYILQTEEETRTKACNQASVKLEMLKSKVAQLKGDSIRDIASSIRGFEGAASKIYFDAYSRFLPPESTFKVRTQHPAMDPANALLNYGYGILYSKVEGAMILAGIDPYIGLLHRDEYNRPVLVYDVIELYRLWVEYVVFRILEKGIFSEDFCSRQQDGSVWLENMGRRVLIQSLNDYLQEVVNEGNKARSRASLIELYVQNLAQKFKNYKQQC